MGVGFMKEDYDGVKMLANPPYDKMVDGNHRFIRGNHDNPGVCKNHTQWIADGTVETTKDNVIMFVGGAWSIDYQWRKAGMSWWHDEECSYEQFQQIIDTYNTIKPTVMVTDDAPESVVKHLFLEGTHKPLYKSRTGSALQLMFEYHKPKIWIFGHWHMNKDEEFLGTRFICLDELHTITLDL